MTVPWVRTVPKVPGVWCLGCLVLLMGAGAANAQEAPALPAHRVVIEGGAVWSGGYAIGDMNAQLRGNAPGSTPPPYTLFTASSDIGSAASVTARVGFTVTPQLVIEGGGSFGMPRLGASITADAEAGVARINGEQLKQYLVDAAVVWHLPLRLGPRLRPFVIGGGGYLRQLHEERTMVESGQMVFAGAGVRYWIRGAAGMARAFGLRTDLRTNIRLGGIDFEDKVRVFPTLAIHLFVSL